MLSSFSYSIPTFHKPGEQTSPRRRPHPAWSALVALRAMWGAFREGLSAHREYEQRRSRGMPHDQALREALGLGARPSRHTRCTAAPLDWAGRA